VTYFAEISVCRRVRISSADLRWQHCAPEGQNFFEEAEDCGAAPTVLTRWDRLRPFDAETMRQFKVLLCALLTLILCTTLVFYASLNQVDREQGECFSHLQDSGGAFKVFYVYLIGARRAAGQDGKHPLVFHEDSSRAQIVVTRLVDIQRQNHLRSQCRQMNATSDLESVLDDQEFLNHVIVDEQHKLLYCYVPKVLVSAFYCSALLDSLI